MPGRTVKSWGSCGPVPRASGAEPSPEPGRAAAESRSPGGPRVRIWEPHCAPLSSHSEQLSHRAGPPAVAFARALALALTTRGAHGGPRGACDRGERWRAGANPGSLVRTRALSCLQGRGRWALDHMSCSLTTACDTSETRVQSLRESVSGPWLDWTEEALSEARKGSGEHKGESRAKFVHDNAFANRCSRP